MRFYVGLHQPGHVQHFSLSCISVNRLRQRKAPVLVGARGAVMIDSGAFSEVSKHGGYRSSVAEYATTLRRVAALLTPIDFAVTQDYMCEPFILERTGLSLAEHQRLTIERYDALVSEVLPMPILPVLQGFAAGDYREHVRAYGDRLRPGMRVGVGSVCKRNASPERIVDVLWAIKSERPDLRLHGFGVKLTSLAHAGVREMLFSADSMAWSFAARKQGRDGNSWREAHAFATRIDLLASLPAAPWQTPLAL